MARLELVAATKEARAPRVRTSAKTVRAVVPPVAINDDQLKDHFITRNGLTYAGSHLIIDLWEAEGLGDRDRIEQALIDAVKAAGATLLHIHLHTFSEGGGISGVAVLAESHISVHTWPEKRLCRIRRVHVRRRGAPQGARRFQGGFQSGRIVIGEHKRGVL